MELGEPEAVGLLDDHDRRVRDVDTDLDHCRRDEDVQLSRLEARHHAPPLRRTQPAVQAADPIATKLGGSQSLGLLLGSTGNPRLGRLDQRADDVRLPAVVEMPAEPRVRLGAPILGHPGRDDRLAVGRRQRELAHLEVAVHGERERARDRRRGEMQDVRAPALDERRPLRDAEAVLLVDDRDGEVAEVDLLLDERVGADDDLRVAGGDELPRRGVLLRPQRARQEGHPDAERRAELVDRQEVLLGERLRRRHERALATGLHGAKERMKGDDRLPRTHLSLEESLHGDRAREVGVELGHRPLLIGRQRERERRAVAVDQLSRLAQRLAPTRARAPRPYAQARAGARAARRRRAGARPTSASGSDRGR